MQGSTGPQFLVATIRGDIRKELVPTHFSRHQCSRSREVIHPSRTCFHGLRICISRNFGFNFGFRYFCFGTGVRPMLSCF